MADLDKYRTAEEIEADAADANRIAIVLDAATADWTSMLVAMGLDEEQDVVETFIDRAYGRLGAELSKMDMEYAIMLLLTRNARRAAHRVLREVRP